MRKRQMEGSSDFWVLCREINISEHLEAELMRRCRRSQGPRDLRHEVPGVPKLGLKRSLEVEVKGHRHLGHHSIIHLLIMKISHECLRALHDDS